MATDDPKTGRPEGDDDDPLVGENTPEAWEHGGEVDQFEAAMASGGEPVPPGEELEPEEADLGVDDVHEAPAGAGTHRVPGAPTTGRRGPRFVNFLRACWAELQRVQWPDRRQVGQATAVVLGFVVIAGAYLGLADVVAQEIVDLII